MSRGEKAGRRRQGPSTEGRDGLDQDEVLAENGRRPVAPHEAVSRKETRRRSSIMFVELVDEIGDQDVNVRDFHEALARLLVRYHATTRNPVAALP
jgi:hypothetical protein